MTICIYHANCPDGFTAAWIVSRALPEVRLHGASYGTPPPEIEPGESVYIVDFSYPTLQLAAICQTAGSVHLWDHHQTTFDAVQDGPWDPYEEQPPNLNTILVKHQSGAQIAWAMLHEKFPDHTKRDIAQIVDRVGDRDLWTFKMEGTAEVFAAMSSYPYTLEAWDEIMERGWHALRVDGIGIQRYRERLVESAVKRVQVAKIADLTVPVVNCVYEIGSDVGARLLAMYPDAPFAAYYLDKTDLRQWGLRSTDERLDVAKVAELYGGGGHRNASGFVTYRPDTIQFLR